MTPAEAIAAIKKFRAGHTLGGLKTKDLINEGRRYQQSLLGPSAF